MGLDMYLTKKIYVGGEYKHNNVSGIIEFKMDKKVIKMNACEVSEIVSRVGYWREARHIHKWFVDNVQEGGDDCGEYEVTIKQLSILKDTCSKVINSGAANKNLPVQTGSSFGSTKYDEYYIQSLKDTVEIIEKLEKSNDSYFYYHSSY